jgi:hypothetical protein
MYPHVTLLAAGHSRKVPPAERVDAIATSVLPVAISALSAELQLTSKRLIAIILNCRHNTVLQRFTGK